MNFSFIRPMAFSVFSSKWFYLFLGGYIATTVNACSNYKQIFSYIKEKVPNRSDLVCHSSTLSAVLVVSLAWPVLLPISAIEGLLKKPTEPTPTPASNEETPTPDDIQPVEMFVDAVETH